MYTEVRMISSGRNQQTWSGSGRFLQVWMSKFDLVLLNCLYWFFFFSKVLKQSPELNTKLMNLGLVWWIVMSRSGNGTETSNACNHWACHQFNTVLKPHTNKNKCARTHTHIRTSMYSNIKLGDKSKVKINIMTHSVKPKLLYTDKTSTDRWYSVLNTRYINLALTSSQDGLIVWVVCVLPGSTKPTSTNSNYTEKLHA